MKTAPDSSDSHIRDPAVPNSGSLIKRPINHIHTDTCEQEEQDDQKCAVQEEGIRQDIDNRIRIRAKEPVIVVKKQLMKHDEESIEINYQE